MSNQHLHSSKEWTPPSNNSRSLLFSPFLRKLQKGPSSAIAEVGVGEGGLPDGARQFSNLVKVQRDWAALGKSITDQGADVTPEEWKNVALFLRKVYQLGGDLEFLAGTFPSEKKKAAVALVRTIQVCALTNHVELCSREAFRCVRVLISIIQACARVKHSDLCS